MKNVFIVAASIAGISLLATPSMAQPQIQFGIGPDGRPSVDVRDPSRERYERRERWRERRAIEREDAYEQGRRDALRQQRYGAYGEERCRVVTIREENASGRMVTRRIRRCG